MDPIPVAAPATLVGRETERGAIGALLEVARAGGSGVLVLRGGPGLGKTVLLDDAERRADGLQVLRATGTGAEREVPFAGLHQLLSPALDGLGALPAPQAAGLRRALGLARGPAPAPLLLGTAVLGVLGESAPVLALIDDAQWLDAPSLAALTFAGRRLAAEGVAMVLALRDDAPATGLPEHVLAPLTDEAAAELLAALAPSARRTVLDAAAGNPLALVELASALSEEQRAGRAPVAEPLPVPAPLDELFAARLAALDPASRALLLVAAAEGTGDPEVVLAAGRGNGDRGRDAFELGGLLTVADGRLRWRHPLVRSAVLRTAGDDALRAAHRALAAVTEPDRAAWHRAAAAPGPDPAAADALAAAGERARARAGHGAAAAALERAAELTPAPAVRAARRVAAATAAWSAGQADVAIRLLDAAQPLDDPADRAEAARVRAAVQLHRGSPATAHRLLAEAARATVPYAPVLALRLGVGAMEAASLAGLPPVLPLAGGPVPDAGPEAAFLHTFAAGVTALFAGEVDAGAEALSRVVEEGARSDDPQLVLWAGAAAFFVGDEDAAVALHERAAALARAAGEATVVAFALTFLATAHLWSGRPAIAEAEADEARRVTRESGQENLGLQADTVLAGIAALRGHATTCRDLAERARAIARERELVLVEGAATIALAELELGLGAPDDAFERLDRLAHGPGAHQAHRLNVVPALVEAAARGGRPGAARADAEAFAGWARATGSSWALPLAARCLGLVADDPAEGDGHFAEALRLHHRHRRPLDLARTELLFGERLRRARRKAEARGALRAALETFEGAGAAPWADRARDELRAAGASAPRPGRRRLDRLTPQELQVARLVARGLSNRDVAAALFLSHRTVEYHLHKVFRKLGVHARGELAAVMAGHETG